MTTPLSISTAVHYTYHFHEEDWENLRDLFAGERAVKWKGTRYLPKPGGQTTEEYGNYKKRAPYFNAVRRTVNGLVGQLFRRPLEVSLGEANADLLPQLNDVTREGLSFSAFARELAREVILLGRHGVLVDLANTEGSKPYFAPYRAEDIRNWKATLRGGRVRVNYILLAETYEYDAGYGGFGMETAQRFRVCTVTGDQYVQQPYNPEVDTRKNGKKVVKWAPGELATPTVEGKPLDEIPFVFFNASSLRPEIEASPIIDIANLNAHHFQKSADLSTAQYFTSVPVFTVSGASEDVEYQVAPSRVWVSPDADTKFDILEFSARGLSFAENAVSKLERDMATLGARLLAISASGGSESPDVVHMRERGEQATLVSIADTLEAGLTRLLEWWLRFQGRDPVGVSVRINKDYTAAGLAYRDLLMLLRLHQARVMPLDTLLRIMYEGEALPVRDTVDTVKELLKQPDQFPVKLDEKLKPIVDAEEDADADEPGRGSSGAADTADEDDNRVLDLETEVKTLRRDMERLQRDMRKAPVAE